VRLLKQAFVVVFPAQIQYLGNQKKNLPNSSQA
jgi:hypothetical protein